MEPLVDKYVYNNSWGILPQEEQLESYPGEEAVEQDEEEEDDDESHLQDGAAAHHAVGAQAKHLIKEHKPLVRYSNI